MRLVRNVFHLSGALIGAGLLLYFALAVISAGTLGGVRTARTSLPGPRRLSSGSSYAVTPDCPVTLLGTDGLFPDLVFARIRSGSLGGDVVLAYRVGDKVSCQNPPGQGIDAEIDAIDPDSVHLTFRWSPR